MSWKNGQAHSIEEAAEAAAKNLITKWYKRGYRAGYAAAKAEGQPQAATCRDCKYWNGKVYSIGVECTNKHRKTNPTPSGVNNIKTASTPACKSGFEPKEKRQDD